MDFVLKKVIEFAKVNPKLVTTNLLLSMTFPIDDILYPYLSGKIVTHVQEKKPWLPWLIAFVTLLVLMQLFYTTSSLHDTKLIPRLHNFIRDSMFKDIITQYKVFQHDDDLHLGEMMSRFVKIPENTVQLYDLIKNYMFPYLVSFLVTAGYITYMQPRLGIVMFCTGVITMFLIATSPKYCMSSTTAQESSLAKFDEQTEDVLRNLHIVYTSNTINSELDRVSKVGDVYRTTYRNTAGCVIVARYVAILVLMGMLIYFVHYSYSGITKGTMKIGTFVTVFFVITQWFTTLGWLSSNMKTIVMEYGIVSAYAKLLAHKVHENTVPLPIQPPKDGLYLHQVSYYIPGRQVPLLKDVTMQVAQGERVAVVGAIGSGKSTLLKLIAQLKTPTEGYIYYNGAPMTSAQVGYVPQIPTLFDRTLYENIVYGVQGATHQDVDTLTNVLGLTEAFDNLEEGMNTMVGKNGSVLSGGQRQLVQLMRVMLMDPPILILDEITASLDAQTKQRLFKVLDILMKGKTVVMVTHDEHLMRQATRLIRLDNGRLMQASKTNAKSMMQYM